MGSWATAHHQDAPMHKEGIATNGHITHNNMEDMDMELKNVSQPKVATYSTILSPEVAPWPPKGS